MPIKIIELSSASNRHPTERTVRYHSVIHPYPKFAGVISISVMRCYTVFTQSDITGKQSSDIDGEHKQ